MKVWIAKDKDGSVYLYKTKPVKDSVMWTEGELGVNSGYPVTISELELGEGVNPHWSDKEPVEVELISKKQTPENLILWSERMQGARAMLMQLMENGMLLEAGWKGASIYTKAQTELILDSLDNTNKFLLGDKILYYDHKRNKSGKLISVKAKFDERKTIYTEV